MIFDKVTNAFSEALVRRSGGNLLDGNNVVWKLVNGRWIGKRSVYTFDNRACWIEETTPEKIKSFWCGGPEADYTEIFYRD